MYACLFLLVYFGVFQNHCSSKGKSMEKNKYEHVDWLLIQYMLQVYSFTDCNFMFLMESKKIKFHIYIFDRAPLWPIMIKYSNDTGLHWGLDGTVSTVRTAKSLIFKCDYCPSNQPYPSLILWIFSTQRDTENVYWLWWYKHFMLTKLWIGNHHFGQKQIYILWWRNCSSKTKWFLYKNVLIYENSRWFDLMKFWKSSICILCLNCVSTTTITWRAQ